jgi:hypothetical protein
MERDSGEDRQKEFLFHGLKLENAKCPDLGTLRQTLNFKNRRVKRVS